ncbi:Nitrite and sulphite reductase 4Fe-4S region [Syntrophobacter sp. SbD1]|nr:Nitrite and sulphite reductase 4Fe-4S region [Syntrophobacter sp. SbD1]
MKADILEKGAIVQRDGETYAIAPHIPGGFIDLARFSRLVDVAEKYNASAMKLTSGQRIAIVGIREEDLPAVWNDLEMSIGYAIGLCVRMVKFCPGTTWCRNGKQDAMGVGLKLDKLYHGYQLPAKFKIGVAGCEYSCAAPLTKEIGLRGTPEGWTVTAGGNGGAKPRLGDIVAEGLDDGQALEMAGRIVRFFEGCTWANKIRLGRVIDKIGLDEFKEQVKIGE